MSLLSRGLPTLLMVAALWLGLGIAEVLAPAAASAGTPASASPQIVDNHPATARTAALPPVGSVVCMHGYASGIWCGTVTRLNVSIYYGQNIWVSGLIEASICSQYGDAGSPVYTTDGRLVGTVVTGTYCLSSSRRTYIQPISSTAS